MNALLHVSVTNLTNLCAGAGALDRRGALMMMLVMRHHVSVGCALAYISMLEQVGLQ